jgi:amino acid transporter
MASHPAAIEHTTALALEEKAKLKKVLRRIDLFFFTLCALVGLDTLGSVASNQEQGFTWVVFLGIFFVIPYALVMAELGSTFTQEGGPYEWMKLCWGRLSSSIGAVMYWVTNPLWVGGSLAFTATAAWSTNIHGVGSGTVGDYIFKLIFIWFSIVVAIASLTYGKWIPNLGAIVRMLVLGFFTITVIVYAAKHGVHGLSAGNFSPTGAALFALAPIVLFNYVGFELGNGAAEEMVNPQRDIPFAVVRSAALTILMYSIPIFGIIFVLPAKAITSLGGFIDAINQVFSVYGGAAHGLLIVMTLGLIFTLMTSGAVWMIGADRIQAVAAFDGAFFPFFGKFNARLGTPIRVNLLSGVCATAFMVVATILLNSASASDAFTVVLDIAISTTLISYLWIFPAGIKLRRLYPDVHRPYQVPWGSRGMWAMAGLITFWVALGSFVAVFPSVLEKIFGIDYGPFKDSWGVSFAKFELLTLVTLAVIVAVAIVGYFRGKRVREQAVDVLIEGSGETVVGTTD